MAAAKKTTGTVLTLLRGRNYTLVHPHDRRLGCYRFTKGTRRIVTDPDVVEYARTLVDLVQDGDGYEIEKPMFRFSAPTEEDYSNVSVTGSRRQGKRVEDSVDDEEVSAPRTRRTASTLASRRRKP